MKDNEKEYMTQRVRVAKRTAEETGARYRDLSPIFNVFLEKMVEVLLEDGELHILPWGTFYLSLHHMKNGYDAIRKQRIPETEVLRINFKPCTALKQRVKLHKDAYKIKDMIREKKNKKKS